jgi:predicted RNA-binding Zn ribbon-like protein
MPRSLGGRLCLDFVNTVDPRGTGPAREFLQSYADLVAWSVHVGELGAAESGRLLRLARSAPRLAASVLARALALRETLHRILSKVQKPRRSDLRLLNQSLEPRTLVSSARGLTWGWAAPDRLDSMLARIAQDAAELLTSDVVQDVKECPGTGRCGWLFLDTTKNGSRRYCSSEGCGNRARVQRFQARHRASTRHGRSAIA